MSPGLPRRIKLAFVAQAAVASVLITIGILLAGIGVRAYVLDERMHREADLWWAARAAQSGLALPHTSTFVGRFVPAGERDTDLPAWLRGLSPGRHRIEVHAQPGLKYDVLVDRRAEGTLDRKSVG